MSLLDKPVHGPGHAGEEERLCLFPAAVPVGGGHEFLGLGNGHGCEEVRKTPRSERRSQT